MKTSYPDSLTIQQYLEGKLDPKLANELEKQALDDPFLWDALEGYSAYRDPASDLSILQRQLHERIVHSQENKKVFDLTWQRLSVAAAAAVMFVSAGILFWMNSQKLPEQLASQSHNPVEVNIIHKDSVEAVLNSNDAPVVASLNKKTVRLDESAPLEKRQSTSEAVVSSKAVGTDVETDKTEVAAKIEGQTMASASVDAPQARVSKVEETSFLNKVIVPGYNNPPKSGWRAYREYLDQSTRKFTNAAQISGSVLISFHVNVDGKLANIKVIRALNEAYDKEAIRIVRNGPEWTPSTNSEGYEGRVEVNFQR